MSDEAEGVWFCEACGSRTGEHRPGYSCNWLRRYLADNPAILMMIPREA